MPPRSSAHIVDDQQDFEKYLPTKKIKRKRKTSQKNNQEEHPYNQFMDNLGRNVATPSSTQGPQNSTTTPRIPRMHKSKNGLSNKQISVAAIMLDEESHLPTYVDKIRTKD